MLIMTFANVVAPKRAVLRSYWAVEVGTRLQ